MSDKQKNHYKTLGVPRDAGKKEINSAYKKLAKEHHPDVHAGSKSAEEKFKEIQEAYETLRDTNRRRRYDEELARAESFIQEAFMDFSQWEETMMNDDPFDWFEDFFQSFPSQFNRLDENLEIILSKKEAKQGGQLSIDLPSYFGLGIGFTHSHRRKFHLQIPPGVKHGELRDMYIPELDFWIRVRISIIS